MMKNMDKHNWRKLFEPFYGKEYCIMITMDLEKLRDEQFQRNTFHFEEGWVRPTCELLKRLTNQGFSIRTKDLILVHLIKPVESMSYGEFYFQAGHQLPGRLSLKFNRRRQADGVHVIQQTVLTPQEESSLAANPNAFLAHLREQARSTQPDYQSLLTTLILIDNQCERQRLNANSFLQNSLQPIMLNLPPQTNHTKLVPVSSPDSVFHPNYPYEALCSFPDISTRRASSSNPYGNIMKPRSGSEGLISYFANHENQRPARQMGPVENDETKQNDTSSSEGSQYVPIKMLHDKITSEELPKSSTAVTINMTALHTSTSKEMPKEAYVDTAHGMSGHSETREGRRESNDSGSGRTNLKSDYVVNALSSLTLDCSTPSDELEKPSFSAVNRRPSHDVQNGAANFPITVTTSTSGHVRYPSINTWLQTSPSLPNGEPRFRTQVQEEYTDTVQAFGNPVCDSWNSHQQLDSHAIYQINHPQHGQSLLCYNPPGLMYPSASGQSIMIPLTVEELNRMSSFYQQPMKESQH